MLPWAYITGLELSVSPTVAVLPHCVDTPWFYLGFVYSKSLGGGI
jgi:hypothetical protein